MEQQFFLTRINRNIVECKDERGYAESQCSQVLIETLWNVKKQALNNIETVFPVLIETLWNVKTSFTREYP